MYENTKAMVVSPDGETEFFDIMAGVLQGDTLAPFLFVIVVDYIMCATIEDHIHLGFTLNKTTSRKQHLTENTCTDTGLNVVDLASAMEDRVLWRSICQHRQRSTR